MNRQFYISMRDHYKVNAWYVREFFEVEDILLKYGINDPDINIYRTVQESFENAKLLIKPKNERIINEFVKDSEEYEKFSKITSINKLVINTKEGPAEIQNRKLLESIFKVIQDELQKEDSPLNVTFLNRHPNSNQSRSGYQHAIQHGIMETYRILSEYGLQEQKGQIFRCMLELYIAMQIPYEVTSWKAIRNRVHRHENSQ